MAIDPVAPQIDMSKLSAKDLRVMQNQVLSAIAHRLAAGDESGAVHDSHSSSHGKNSVAADLGRIASLPANVAKPGGG